jgi:lipoprotein-anchoring transpeptidase ErfK/SrfK
VGSHQMRRIAAVLIVGVLALLAGCRSSSPAASGSSTAQPSVAPAQVAVTPADGSANLTPTTPVQVKVTDGKLSDVTVAAAEGAQVAGQTAPAADDPTTSVWTPTTPLAYGTTYTVTAKAANAASAVATVTSTFTTVEPGQVTTPSIGPLDGTTVGVGMPIRVFFDQPVTDQAAVESHLKVTSSTPTDGSWNWLSPSEVHFRPSAYWPANTDVTLTAALYGVDFGNGIWGEKDRTVTFHVGAAHVSVADAAAHTLTVKDGGAVVQTYPMSAGSAANPTRNGAHVVLQSYRNITMDSSTFGLAVDAPGGYRADVEYAVRISNNGEFVHAAPWSVAQQGRSNVSHGCINLSTPRAAWFFNFAQPGDVVEVVNSNGPTLSRADGDIYDWAIPWSEWTAGSALS